MNDVKTTNTTLEHNMPKTHTMFNKTYNLTVKRIYSSKTKMNELIGHIQTTILTVMLHISMAYHTDLFTCRGIAMMEM